jgi:hypothetical protein
MSEYVSPLAPHDRGHDGPQSLNDDSGILHPQRSLSPYFGDGDDAEPHLRHPAPAWCGVRTGPGSRGGAGLGCAHPTTIESKITYLAVCAKPPLGGRRGVFGGENSPVESCRKWAAMQKLPGSGAEDLNGAGGVRPANRGAAACIPILTCRV